MEVWDHYLPLVKNCWRSLPLGKFSLNAGLGWGCDGVWWLRNLPYTCFPYTSALDAKQQFSFSCGTPNAMPNKVPFRDLWGQFCTTYFWLSFGWFTGLITFSDSKSYFARCVQFFIGGRKPWGGQTLLSEAVNHRDATAQTLPEKGRKLRLKIKAGHHQSMIQVCRPVSVGT